MDHTFFIRGIFSIHTDYGGISVQNILIYRNLIHTNFTGKTILFDEFSLNELCRLQKNQNSENTEISKENQNQIIIDKNKLVNMFLDEIQMKKPIIIMNSVIIIMSHM